MLPISHGIAHSKGNIHLIKPTLRAVSGVCATIVARVERFGDLTATCGVLESHWRVKFLKCMAAQPV